MNAHALLKFIKRVGKIDKMRGLPSISSFFHSEFNLFNNTGARMLDSIYHMTLKLLKNHIFCIKMQHVGNLYATLK